jgi:hypothetical protein
MIPNPFSLKIQYKESQYRQRGPTAEIPLKIARKSKVNANISGFETEDIC